MARPPYQGEYCSIWRAGGRSDDDLYRGLVRDEIHEPFNVGVKVVYTNGHADHVSGGQVFQKDGTIVVANLRTDAPICFIISY